MCAIYTDELIRVFPLNAMAFSMTNLAAIIVKFQEDLLGEGS